MNSMPDKLAAFERLLHIMDDLRAQCPWDKKQTFQTLRNLTIEEVYELAEVLIEEDLDGIKEEVGDIMLHLVFYAKIGSEKNAFDIADVLNSLCDKLIHRHPHIYGDVVAADEETVKKNWEKLKLKEGKKSILQGVPSGLPAMVKAYRIQEKVKQVGFEWEEKAQVWTKVLEEQQELIEAESKGDKKATEEEFGDLLFALINYARFIDVDPEAALEKTNKKFKRRFEFIEETANKNNQNLEDMSLDEMDAIWNAAKKVVYL